MEVRILGKIKSDGFRYLAVLYRFVTDIVQETGSMVLSSEDKGYIDYFSRKLNMYELLKKKKQKLICLVTGLVENTKRHFKQDVPRMYFDEPKGQDAIHNYTRYYITKMNLSSAGKELLEKLPILASEVRKLLKLYNCIFYKEPCPQHIQQDCDKMFKHIDYKSYVNTDTHQHLEYVDDFSKLTEQQGQAIIKNISVNLIAKIIDNKERSDLGGKAFEYPKDTSIIDHRFKSKSDKQDTLDMYVSWFAEHAYKRKEDYTEIEKPPEVYLEILKEQVEKINALPRNEVTLPEELLYDFDKVPVTEGYQSKLGEDIKEGIALQEVIDKTQALFDKNTKDPFDVIFYHLMRLKYKLILIQKRIKERPNTNKTRKIDSS